MTFGYMTFKHPENRKIIAGCILFAAGFILLLLARNFPGFAQWYSTHIYPIWTGTLGRLAGIFPFSVSELLLYAVLFCIIFTFLKALFSSFRKKGIKFFTQFSSRLLGLFLFASVLFLLYALNCGINYHRKSFADSAGLQLEEYTVQELKDVCVWLTGEINERSSQVERNEEGLMEFPTSKEDEWDVNEKRLGEDSPSLSGFYPKPKGLIFSWILSVQQLTGIYSPFTVEANYNSDAVDYSVPFTACHELSHLKGFMQEEEANFIAFLASSTSDDVTFQYSGYLMGWTYCMNTLYRADYDTWEKVRETLRPEIETDLAANREFWAKYDTKAAEVSNKINDTYLKANKQNEGVNSYNKMVDLIVAYRRQY